MVAMHKEVVIDLIRNYKTTTDVCKALGVSFDHNARRIKEIAKEAGLLELLKESNNTSGCGRHHVYKIHAQAGDQIKQLVMEGACIKDLVAVCNIPKYTVVKYLKVFGWYNQARLNGSTSRNKALLRCSYRVRDLNLFRRKYNLDQIQKEVAPLGSLKTKAELIRHCVQAYGMHATTARKMLCGVECQKHDNTGVYNSMYGVAPSPSSGIGASGRLVYEGHMLHFRSSLELRVFLTLIKSKVVFSLSRHRVKYTDPLGSSRTYNPDIVVGDCVYEIKPKKLTNTQLNQAKMKALEAYCSKFNLKCAFWTEETTPLISLTKKIVDELIERGQLNLSNNSSQKSIHYIQ